MPSEGAKPNVKAGRFAFAAMLLFAAFMLLSAAYIGGYLWLGEERRTTSMHDSYENGVRVWIDDGLTIERVYSQSWLARLFQPAGWIESRLRGVQVQVTADEPLLILLEGTSMGARENALVEVID